MLAWIIGTFGMLLAGLGAGGTIRPAGLATVKHGQPSRWKTIVMHIIGIMIWVICYFCWRSWLDRQRNCLHDWFYCRSHRPKKQETSQS